jgi:hypothetical protein
MTKRQLIDEIRQYNTSVQPQFLAQFGEPALKEYLEHLQDAVSKQLRIGGRIRQQAPAQPKFKLVS